MEPFYFQPTTATKRIADMQGRIRAVAGGTSASKTISIIFWLIDYCGSDMGRAKLATVVSESYPHLEKGAMLDFENIMKDRGYWKDDRWNKSKHQYTFETGNILEFFSVDTYGKAHGPRRDVLFLNECNNLHYNIVDQLITRTREIVWLDWNPTNEFWFYTEMLGKRDDIDFITVTYKDNEALDQTTIDEIESHRHNKNWWRVYGEGQLGDVEGRVFTGWAFIDEIPHEARLERRGLDFGYSNDPTALIDIYYYNGGFILDERLYRKGLTNKQIADYINNMEHPEVTVYADSAEPKSIDEIRSYGVTVLAAQKGQGSVNQGISYVQDQQVSVTKRSTNLRHEYMNYMWETDKDGNIINKPMDDFNHGMDATRYGLEGYMRGSTAQVGIVTSMPYKEENKSFVVNEDGEAEGFHINMEDVAKRAMDDERYRQ
jgi:phage terminase large subunit